MKLNAITATRVAPKRWVAGGLVAAALIGVAVLPGTGWLVRQQAQMLFSGPTAPAWMGATPAQNRARQVLAAQAHPEDFPLQMALALRQSTPPNPNNPAASGAVNGAASSGPDEPWVPGARLQALQGLEARYSRQPSLYAAILRDLSLGAVKLDHRKDQSDLDLPRPDTGEKPSPPVVHAAALREWERAAVQGEQLDPTNAFFPFMRAVGLFAQYRDDEAAAEIVKAAALPRFEDYVQDEATGGWTLAEAGQNGQPLSSVSRVAISAATLLPHYALMRAATRLATVEAVRQEQAGNNEAGFAIRRALTRCGARMRTDSHWLIGSFVGEAIANTAQARPGGVPPLAKADNSLDDRGERHAQRVRAAYETYLNRIGHPEETTWVEHEATARQEIKTITDKGLDKGPSSISNLVGIARWWFGGMALLSNGVWMLVLGAIAARLTKTRRIQNGERLHRGIVWGLGLSALPIALWAAGNLFGALNGLIQESVVETLIFAVPVLAAVGFLWRRDWLRRMVQSRVRIANPTASTAKTPSLSRPFGTVAVAAVTMVSLGSMAGLLAWMSGGISGYTSTLNMLAGLSPDTGGTGETNPVLLCLVSVVSLAALAIVPALTGMALAIASRVRRVPVSVGVVRGFSRAALPVAAILSLLYVGVAGVTCAQEQAADTEIRALVTHEGRTCARFARLPWPSFAP